MKGQREMIISWLFFFFWFLSHYKRYFLNFLFFYVSFELYNNTYTYELTSGTPPGRDTIWQNTTEWIKINYIQEDTRASNGVVGFGSD